MHFLRDTLFAHFLELVSEKLNTVGYFVAHSASHHILQPWNDLIGAFLRSKRRRLLLHPHWQTVHNATAT